jgi:hypothetical protein
MTAVSADITLVVRECGERTADACAALLSTRFPGHVVHRVSGRPFNATLRSGLELGLREGRKWTLCIDADVLPLPRLVDFVASADELPAGMLGMQALVVDNLLGVRRPAGNHLYRTELIAAALAHIPAAGALRPESAMIDAMARAGMPFRQSLDVIGLHDYEQYLRDIYAKAFLHGHKHRYLREHFEPVWRDLARSDDDFGIALAALEDAGREGEIAVVGRDHTAALASAAIGRLGLEEKPPLGTAAPQLAERLLAAEQVVTGAILARREKLQAVIDADLAAVEQARRASVDVAGQAVAICMLSIGQERQRTGELLELSGRYVAAGAQVYWISFDALAAQAGFELPPGVRWLRLCEPGLRSGSLREALALATRLAPVLDYLAPAVTMPFRRSARHAVRLARLAAGSSTPAWLRGLLRLVSPRRHARLRDEAAAAEAAVAEIFDAAWYGGQYRVGGSRDDLAGHFLHVGQYLGHSPHPLFWASWYGEQYLRDGPAAPLGHYFYRGADDDLNPNPFFYTKWYREQAGLPSCGKANPLAHYLSAPDGASIDPDPLFDARRYLQARPDLRQRTPLEDFVLAASPPCPFPLLERIPSLREDVNGRQLSYATLFGSAFAMRQPAQGIHHIEARPHRPPRRFAICSVITGDYELPRPVIHADAEIDYYLLADRPVGRSPQGWKSLNVPVPPGRDAVRHSRYLKMHLAEFVPAAAGYDAIAYADGNLQFVGPLAGLFHDFADSLREIGLITHPLRCCVFQEAAAILLLQKDAPANVMRVIDFLLKERVSPNSGLFEMNFFMFKPVPSVRRLFEKWWRLFEVYGNRDQLLLPYALSKQPVPIHPLLPEGVSVRNVDSIVYHPHNHKGSAQDV